jgi:hypothetical protein
MAWEERINKRFIQGNDNPKLFTKDCVQPNIVL